MRIHLLVSVVLYLIAAMTCCDVGLGQRAEGQPTRGGFSFDNLIERHDRDQDGKVTRDEFRGPKQFFDRMDADSDGTLTSDEIKRFGGRARGRGAQPSGADQRRPSPDRQQRQPRRLPVPESVKVHKDIAYAKVGDETLLLDLYLPQQSEKKPPLLVWIHGGGWRNGSKQGINPMFVRLTAAGYATASINYRLNGLQAHPEHTHDCKGAVRWLRAHADQYGYDVARIGVGGGSAGGHLVLMLGMTADVEELEGDIGGNLDQSSRVHAVVDLFGPSEFPLSARDSERFRGRYSDAQDLWKSASPLNYLSEDDAPVLIFQGDQDRTVPKSQSELLHRRYQAAGLDSTLHIIKGAGHGGPQFSDSKRYDLVKAFLDKHVKQTH